MDKKVNFSIRKSLQLIQQSTLIGWDCQRILLWI